jgi:hypothetical protein
MKVPKRAQVDTSIRGVKRQVRSTLKAVNLQAGKLLSRGRYGDAEELVRIGRAIDAFEARVEDLRKEWRTLTTTARGRKEGGEQTPLWRFYHPVVKALLSVGGKATLPELEKVLPPFLEGQATPADLAPGARGIPRWRLMLKRARRPMVKEGFLEKAPGGKWYLSAEGKRLAQAEAPTEAAK